MSDYNYSIVIPTKAREHSLVSAVSALADQTLQPKDVIIINDGFISEKNIDAIESALGVIPLTITESNGPAGTGTAINTGAEVADGDVVVVIPDDAEIGEEYLHQLDILYNEHEDAHLAGIGLVGVFKKSLEEDFSPLSAWLILAFRKIFYLNTTPGTLNKAGFGFSARTMNVIKADYISGAGASYKRELILKYRFQHWEGGREVHEDYEFCWRLNNAGYHFISDPSLPLNHEIEERHDGGWTNGIKKGRNRVRMFAVNGKRRHTPLFVWAMIGKILAHFLYPFLSDSKRVNRSWREGVGMFLGLVWMLPMLFGITSPRDSTTL